jgi:hypothetical protein
MHVHTYTHTHIHTYTHTHTGKGIVYDEMWAGSHVAKAVSRRLQCGTSRGQADWVSDILAGKPSYSVDDARARTGGGGGGLGGLGSGWGAGGGDENGGEVQYGGEMEEDDELKMLTDRLPRQGEPMLPVCIVCA